MKKNGFTLIELLGVIVILALLAVLVFPSIINSVRSSSKKTDDLTLELIYNAADLYIDNHKGEFYKNNGNEYSINLKDLVDEGLLISPIKLSESNDDLTNKKCVQVSYNDGFDYELKDIGACKTIYSNGSIIYFDVYSGKACSASEYELDNSKTGYNGYTNKDENNNETEKQSSQNSCLKFYAFNDSGEETLNLLLDHNTTALIAWTNSETETNANGPMDVIKQLYNDTKEWQGTITPIDYTMDQKNQTSGVYYTIEYSKTPSYEGATTPYKARLITAQEIAQITGADKEDTLNFKEESFAEFYYFDSLTTTPSATCDGENITGCKYGWLYDRTSTDCTTIGCLNNSDSSGEYWTSSAYASDSLSAWVVDLSFVVGRTNVSESNFGVRPVITVLKSNI